MRWVSCSEEVEAQVFCFPQNYQREISQSRIPDSGHPPIPPPIAPARIITDEEQNSCQPISEKQVF